MNHGVGTFEKRSYAVAQQLAARLESSGELKILVGDRNYFDQGMRAFAEGHDAVPLFEGREESWFDRLVRRQRKNPFLDYLPGLNSSIQAQTTGYEVYHCTDWLLYRSRHARVNAITCYDLTARKFPQFHEHLNIAKEELKLRLIPKFDYVFCISESTRHDVLEATNADPSRVIVNYIDVDPVFKADAIRPRDEVLEKYKIPKGANYLLSVSTIEPRKNFKAVLEAFEVFSQRHSRDDFVLVCTGMWGWKDDELKKFLADSDFGDRVIFTGFADLADLPSLYRYASCFLYLSFYEGFGLPILEAMRSRCPVVCSNTSSMPEVIGDAGVCVDPIDLEEIVSAVEKMVFDEELAARSRSAGYERSELFSWDRHVDALLNRYREAL